MMLIKLYKNIFSSPPPPERKKLFVELYQENGVELMGVWKNKNNPLEYYMLTKYRDQDHYDEFISTIKSNEEYLRMTQKVSEVRLSSEIIDLVDAE